MMKFIGTEATFGPNMDTEALFQQNIHKFW